MGDTSAINASAGANPSPVGNASSRRRDHFATDHLLHNLKGRTVSSGVVTGVAQVANFTLNFLSIAVLARLLTPQDFGLVAMVTTITGFLRIFNDAGLSTATVQREGITHAQVSNLFWANVSLGGAITLLLASLAWPIAWFYHDERLVGVTLGLCSVFLLTSSTVQHLALLKRQMEFKIIAMIQVGAAFIGVLVAIVMAWKKCGYWSLIGLQLATAISNCVLTWWFSHWHPQMPTRRSGTRSLLNFGANLTASAFLWSLSRGSDGMMIGRIYGAESLGLYSRAQALLNRPLEQFMSPFEAVIVPTLCRLQNQPDRYRRIVLRVYEAIAVVSFMFSGLLLGLARPITLVVLGKKWEDAAPIFAAFTLVALHTPMGSVSTWLLTSQGRGKDFLKLSTIGSVMAVVAFVIGMPFGPKWVALSYSIFCVGVALPLSYYISGRTGPVSAKDLAVRFFMHLPVWVAVCGSILLMRPVVAGFKPVLQLAVCVPVGLLTGIAFVFLYPPSRRAAWGMIETFQEFKRGRKGAA